jgi:hypothetical protein
MKKSNIYFANLMSLKKYVVKFQILLLNQFFDKDNKKSLKTIRSMMLIDSIK